MSRTTSIVFLFAFLGALVATVIRGVETEAAKDAVQKVADDFKASNTYLELQLQKATAERDAAQQLLALGNCTFKKGK